MNENQIGNERGAVQKVRRTAAERETLINEFRRSGLSRDEFARQHGIAKNTFTYWLRPRDTVIPQFAEVKVASAVQVPLEVELKNGVRIRLCCTDERIGLAELIREVLKC